MICEHGHFSLLQSNEQLNSPDQHEWRGYFYGSDCVGRRLLGPNEFDNIRPDMPDDSGLAASDTLLPNDDNACAPPLFQGRSQNHVMGSSDVVSRRLVQPTVGREGVRPLALATSARAGLCAWLEPQTSGRGV
jgi:hypothetical protein